MTDENKEILEQVTELISSKKETLKTKKIDEQGKDLDEKKKDNESNDSITQSSTYEDSFIRSEVRKWIDKNAEEIAKDIIRENAKKIFK